MTPTEPPARRVVAAIKGSVAVLTLTVNVLLF